MDETKDEHYHHMQAPPCDGCAKEQKRLAVLSIVAGMALGAGAVFLALKAKNG